MQQFAVFSENGFIVFCSIIFKLKVDEAMESVAKKIYFFITKIKGSSSGYSIIVYLTDHVERIIVQNSVRMFSFPRIKGIGSFFIKFSPYIFVDVFNRIYPKTVYTIFMYVIRKPFHNIKPWRSWIARTVKK